MRNLLRFLSLAAILFVLPTSVRADLYIIGEVEGAGWSANLGIPMTETSTDCYEITIPVNGTFGFATQLGANADDWNGLNSNRYGAEYDGYALQSGVEAALYKNSNAYSIVPGEYNITVDMAAGKIVATATTPLVFPESVYVCGDLEGYGWSPNMGVELEQQNDGIYTGVIVVAGKVGAGVESLGYVCFAKQLSETADDWTTFDANRYGPTTFNQVAAPSWDYLVGANTNSFGISGGEYEVTLDLNTNIVRFEPTGDITYSFPEAIYMIGEVEGASGWVTTAGYEIAQSADVPGEYSAVITINDSDNSYFGFVAQLNSEADAENWPLFNAGRYVPVGDGVIVPGEGTNFVMSGDASFFIDPGTYDCVIKLNSVASGTITLSEHQVSAVETVAAEETARPVAGVGQITIDGEATSVDVYNAGGARIATDVETVTCPAGVYVVVVDGTVYKVIVR